MKAISIKQPWAWAIANGHKTIETRTWPTKYRGDLLIVASKTSDRAMVDWMIKNTPGGAGVARELEYGKALAVAKMVDCRPMTKADEDDAMCSIYPKAFSWVLQDIKRIQPFDVRGQLKIYDVRHVPGICRVCGCTDFCACPGGCSWIETDLCSACMRK